MIKRYILLSELLFWIAYIPYLAILLVELSLYKEIILVNSIVKVIRYCCYLILISKFLLDAVYERKYILYTVWIGVLLGLSAIGAGDKQMFCLLLFFCASYNVDFEKIIKVSLVVHISVMCMVFGGCFFQILDNRIYEEGSRIRYSLGYGYTTTSANLFMHIILMWICIRKDKLKFAEIFFLIITNFILFRLTDTKAAFAFGMLAIFATLLFKIKLCRKCYLKLGVLFKLIIPGSVMLTGMASILYNEKSLLWNMLNEKVNGRIKLAHDAFVQYGYNLFGNQIKWVGSSKYETGLNALKEYNYVDSAYVQVALQFGVVFLILVCTYYWIVLSKSIKNKNFYLSMSIVIILLHSIMDPQLVMLSFHPFMLGLGYICYKDSNFKISV